MLGYDWLASIGCQWHFDKSIIVINARSISLGSRPARASVHRILVRDGIIIDADTQASVPIRLAYVNLHAPAADWVVNCKELRQAAHYFHKMTSLLLFGSLIYLGHHRAYAGVFV